MDYLEPCNTCFHVVPLDNNLNLIKPFSHVPGLLVHPCFALKVPFIFMGHVDGAKLVFLVEMLLFTLEKYLF